MRRFATWRFSTAEEWRRAARRLRREYPNAIGIPDDAQPLKVVKMGRADLPEYSRTEYHIQTGEHTWSNTILMQPRNASGPRPTILYLPGSGSDVAKQEMQFAHEVIAFGWNACVIDARAALYPFHPGIAEGRAILPQGLHDLRCCCNWLFEQTCVDKKRVATMGVSQGGTHSWMLTAVEPRIAATAPVCGICTYASLDQLVTDWYGGGYSSFFDSHSIYYFPPALLQLAEQQDVCALIAPRPFMFVGATHDNCFPVDGMRMAAEDIRHVYRLLGAEDNFVYYEFDGPHSMPEHSRKAAYSFFRKVFNKIH
jgi:dienelactone hydrolase